MKPANPRKAKLCGYRQGNGLWVDGYSADEKPNGHIKDYSVSSCWQRKEYYIRDFAPHKPGDILYVKEAWGLIPDENGREFYVYREEQGDSLGIKWRSPMFMPKAAARIFLRVTEVRAEKLWEGFFNSTSPILELQAEGIDIGDTCRECIENYRYPCCVDAVDDDGTDMYGGECGMLDDARSKFAELWDSINSKRDGGRYAWNKAPFIWAYTFTPISKEEAEREDAA